LTERGLEHQSRPRLPLIIGLRESAPLHIASFAFRVLVDSSRTASETVVTFLAIELLITARLSDNLNLLVQVVIELL
jgi:hypothetical protein